MPRPVNRQLSPEVSDGNYDLELEIGAVEGGAPRQELKVAWLIRRSELMGYSRLPGTRPWAFWVFELGEEPPRHPHYVVKPSAWPSWASWTPTSAPQSPRRQTRPGCGSGRRANSTTAAPA